MCGWMVFSGRAGNPLARSLITSAASFPASVAPSIDPRNFCEVKHPHSVRLGMGVVWLGRYLLRPGMAAYTLRGTLTTENLRSLALPLGPWVAVAGHLSSCAISVGKRRDSSPMVASIISSSDLAIQLVLPPASGEQGAKTSSIMDASGSAYSLQVMDMSAYTERRGEREKQRWSTPSSFRSNHMCRLMTGMPSSSSICRK
mmetsp:Transcript_5192/g.10942  ORF Transcript_5192/g.10942 Transcript_5192/m.10942 type:complete len:201 (+) Transcript_5192:230-832(+)